MRRGNVTKKVTKVDEVEKEERKVEIVEKVDKVDQVEVMEKSKRSKEKMEVPKRYVSSDEEYDDKEERKKKAVPKRTKVLGKSEEERKEGRGRKGEREREAGGEERDDYSPLVQKGKEATSSPEVDSDSDERVYTSLLSPPLIPLLSLFLSPTPPSLPPSPLSSYKRLQREAESRIIEILNNGDKKSLLKLDGVGEKRAIKIMEHRKDNPPFTKVNLSLSLSLLLSLSLPLTFTSFHLFLLCLFIYFRSRTCGT